MALHPKKIDIDPYQKNTLDQFRLSRRKGIPVQQPVTNRRLWGGICKPRTKIQAQLNIMQNKAMRHSRLFRFFEIYGNFRL